VIHFSITVISPVIQHMDRRGR